MYVIVIYSGYLTVLCFQSVRCSGLIVSTCQVIGYKDLSDDALLSRDYLHKDQIEECIFVYCCY